jgi:hypothetical protein
MWLDERGVVHTVAVPEPSSVLGPELVSTIATAKRSERKALDRALERLRDSFYESMETQFAPLGVENGVPDRGLLADDIIVSDIPACLERVSLIWRIDLIDAVQDVLDGVR